jgi:hypothetical protein
MGLRVNGKASEHIGLMRYQGERMEDSAGATVVVRSGLIQIDA